MCLQLNCCLSCSFCQPALTSVRATNLMGEEGSWLQVFTPAFNYRGSTNSITHFKQMMGELADAGMACRALGACRATFTCVMEIWALTSLDLATRQSP